MTVLPGGVAWALTLVLSQAAGAGQDPAGAAGRETPPSADVAPAQPVAAPLAVRRILDGEAGPDAWLDLARSLAPDSGAGGTVLDEAPVWLARSVADSLASTARPDPSFLARMGLHARYAWSNLLRVARPMGATAVGRTRAAFTWIASRPAWLLGGAGACAALAAWLLLRFGRRRGSAPEPRTASRSASAPRGRRAARPGMGGRMARSPRGRSAAPACRDAARLEARLRSMDAA